MTKKELEIRCKVMEERLNRIYEICNQYSHDRDAPTAIGRITANCDPDLVAEDIEWRL